MPELAATMNAVLLTGHGGYDRLEYRTDVTRPVPGAGEVLVRVRAAGVNNTDINMRVGWYSKAAMEDASAAGAAGWTGGSVAFPLIQGADVCGYIVATGTEVAASRIGERVLIDPVLRGPPGSLPSAAQYLGSDCNGGFAEYVRVPASNAYSIDTEYSDAELASLPCSYSAAENMLTRAAVAAGEVVLVTGASGGVGSAAVQLAKRRGATVIAVAGAAKAAKVVELGASQVLPRGTDLTAALGAESVDVVIDVVGGGDFPRLLEVLRRGQRYAVAGAIAGAQVALDLRVLYLKDLRLLGCTIPEPEVFGNLVHYVASGQIRPLLAETFALKDIAVAQRAFLEKRHTGKFVLIP